MRLFLDDMEDRIDAFLKHYGEDNVVITRTVEETIKALSSQEFEWVSLDHDLGGNVYCPSDEESGMEVVRWIVENKPEIPHIIVHSWNIPASIRMANALYDAGYSVEKRPFGFGRSSFQRG